VKAPHFTTTKRKNKMTQQEIKLMKLALKIAFAGAVLTATLAMVLGDIQSTLISVFIAGSAIAGNFQLTKEIK
jgi:hypothetical protein